MSKAAPRNVTAQVVVGVLLLLCGIAIYLLFRSRSITLYQWCISIGLSAPLEVLRADVQHWIIPDFVKFSLPDGLYGASYILLMDAVWNNSQRLIRIMAASLIPLVAIIHEMLQGLGLAKGTFDAADLLCYSVPLSLYLWRERNQNSAIF